MPSIRRPREQTGWKDNLVGGIQAPLGRSPRKVVAGGDRVELFRERSGINGDGRERRLRRLQRRWVVNHGTVSDAKTVGAGK